MKRSTRDRRQTTPAAAGHAAVAAAWIERPAGQWTVLAAVLVYVALFYRTELTAFSERLGQPYLRINLVTDCVRQLGELPAGGHASWTAAADRWPVLLLAAGVLTCAWAVGWLALAVCRATRDMQPAEQTLFALGVGTNLVSTYVLAVGLAGGLRQRWLLVGPAVLVIAAAVGRLVHHRRRATAGNDPSPPAPLPLGERGEEGAAPLSQAERRVWLAALAVFAVVLVAGALLPPWEFDVREYHLQAPKEFFQQGRITFLPHNVYANMALGSEMLTLGAMAASGDWWLGALAGKTILALLAVATAAGIFTFGRRWFSPRAGLIGAVLYLSIPWVFNVATSGLIDMAAAWYWLLTLAALVRWDRQPASWQRGALLGYLAGSAVACKYPGALFVAVPVVAWVKWRLVREKITLRPLVACLCALLLACGLWFAKNAVLTGNPTYPLLSGVFSTATRTPPRQEQWNRVHQPRDFTPRALLRDLRRVALDSPWLAPLVVPLAALALLKRRSRVVWLAVGALAWVLAAWWLFTHRIDRFWIPLLPLMALLAGVGWTRLTVPLCRRAAQTLLVVTLLANLLTVTSGVLGDARYLAPLETLRRDPQRLGVWRQWLNEHVTAGRLLVVGDAQVFDYRVPILYSTCFDESPWEQLARDRSPAEIQHALLEQQISMIYVDWGEIARYRRPGNYGFTDFVQPEMFERLIKSGVLEAVPPIADQPGRAYWVCPGSPRGGSVVK